MDGEGTFTVVKSNTPGPHPYFTPLVTVSNTNKNILCWIRKTLSIHNRFRPRKLVKNCKRLYELVYACDNAREFITRILPYLKMKQKVAKEVLEFPKRHCIKANVLGWGGTKPDLKTLKIQLAAVKRIRAYNKRGTKQ